nr:MAG: hypothetical protein 1 [Leviviridae sp.]
MVPRVLAYRSLIIGNKSYTIRKRFEYRKSSLATGLITTVGVTQEFLQQRVGEDTPNFKALAAKGKYCTNNLVASRRNANFYPSSATKIVTADGSSKGKTYFTEVHHPFPGLASSIDASALLKASNDAATQIRKKIQEENSTFSGPTFLGELRETAQMIKKPAKALADYLNKAAANSARKKRRKKGSKRKRDLARKNSTADAIGGSWLELSFGAMPFVADIAAIAEASLRRYDEVRIKRISAVGHGENSLSVAIRPATGSDTIRYNRNVDRTESVQVKYLVGMRTSVQRSNNALERVIAQSRMNWSEIIPAAWELLPGSFLLDYFGNIGDILSAHSVSLANVAWSQRTTRITCETQDIGVSMEDYSSTQDLLMGTMGSSHSTYKSVHREDAEIPIPEFRFELPGRKTQLLNLAALLNTLL